MIENTLSFKREVILRRVAEILTGHEEFVIKEVWDPQGERLVYEARLRDGSDWKVKLVLKNNNLLWFILVHRDLPKVSTNKVEEAIAIILGLRYHASEFVHSVKTNMKGGIA